MSLLVVGSVAFDAIETPFGKTEWTAGGAATYFSLAAALLSPVGLVGVVGEDFTAKDEAVFRGRKIDLAGLERASGNVSRIAVCVSGEYRSSAAAERAEADAAAAKAGGAGHHELLDFQNTKRTRQNIEADRCAADQR